MNRIRLILLIAIVLLALGLAGGALAAARTAQAALVMPGSAGESQPQMSATRLSQPPANISRNDTLPPSPAKTGAVNAPASFSPQPGYFIAQHSPNKAGEWLGEAGVTAFVNYAHDWVIARSAPNTTVTVTLTSTTGTRYTQVGQTDGGGELRTFDRPWDPGQPDISPGAVVTVETDTAMTEVDPVGTISGLVDGETDTVAGTVNAPWFAPENLTVLCEVWVPDGPPPVEVTGVAADGGSFTCDFASVGWDILPGQDITVMYLEPDGDRVINMTGIPWTRVNFSHDWVGINFPQGHTFWITVTDETGAVKAIAEVETFANGGWGGEGFETKGLDWSPRQPDIQPGDWVNFEADTGYTNQVRVGSLSGEVDAEDDQVSGTVTAEWFTQPLNVECHPWGGPGSAQPKSSTAAPDGSTTYQCQWDPLNEWDILPGQDVGVMYIEPDNDRVVGVFHHPAPNLSIQTWMDGAPAEGGNVEFRIQFLNDGDGAAPGTVITATLEGLHYLSDTSSLPVTTGTTPDGDETVRWVVGDLPPGTLNHQFRLFAAVTRPAGSEITNQVEIETSLNYSQWEPWRKENIWTGQVEPNDTHLNVGKNAWTGDPVAGEQFVWAVNTCNNANTGSSELVVTDTLPISTTLVGWWGQHPGWSEVSRDDEELVLSRPALAGHQCSEVYLRFQLDDAAWVGMPISNTAEIFALSDSETEDNETTSWVWVSHPRTNLAVYKDWQRGQLVPGGDVYYELSYRNNGNLPVENVQLVNDLPEGTSFIGSWYSDELGEHPVTPNEVTAGRVVWDIGKLANGFEGRLSIGLHIDEDTTPGTVLNQRVEISAPAAEQRYDDNSIAWVDTVNGAGANLRVTKQNYRWNGQGGIEYEIRVMNLGSQPLENVWITDTYPAETTFNNWWVNNGPSAMDGTSLPESHQVRYWIERLNPGDTASLGLDVNLDGEITGEQGLSFTNQVNAPVSGDTYPADNSDQVTAYTGPDVYVTKTLSGGQLRPGEIVTFTVHFGNRNQWPWDGDRDFGSHITETLPSEMTFISATAPWNPQEEWIPESIEGNTIVWGWDTMWSSSDSFFDVVVQIADSVEGGDVLTNRIRAFGDSPNDVEANWANNEFELPVTIQNPKFAVNKTYESSRVAGTVIKYMLAVNNTGNRAGTALRLTDPLPGGVTYGGGGSLANGLVSWTVPSLAPGSQATSWFTGTLSCTAGTPINNQNYRVASSAEGVSSANGPAVTFTTQAPALSATFSVSPQSATPGEAVQFTANATTNGTPLTYAWDFDDGTTATGKITSHTFTAPGDYKVTLQVKDACGFTKTYTATIHIAMYKLYLPMTLNGNKP